MLIVGGGVFTSVREDYHPSAELWDPATGTFEPAGTLSAPRSDHTASLLPDGRVLVIGGFGRGGVHSSAEIWEPTTPAEA